MLNFSRFEVYKNKTFKYATGGLANKIFVSKYQLYLPDKKVLENKVKEIIDSE